jgi:acyl-CoA reductase-like NAD-dependent aldehyde dehydrogenase
VTPLASSTIAPMIARQLEEAVARGARVLTGGGVHGDFVEPTVISDVPVDCALWQDETFGPVLPVRVARDEDAAVADALGGRYGLHGIVTGGGAQELASRMVGEPLAVPVSELRYGAIGTVTIDRRQFADPEDEHRPFGGWGVSGWVRHADGTLSQGPRLLAREATREA